MSRGQSPEEFLADFERRRDMGNDTHVVLDMLAMSACYSPNPDAALGYDVPIELERAERIEDVWQRWLSFDPLIACERYRESLAQLELLHLECGRADEFNLQFGLRRLVRRLRELGVACDHVEHDGGHRGIDARYGVVLARLAAVLAGRR